MQKETIGIFIGNHYNQYWDEHTVENGMGGSETWAIELGKALANRGYEIIMYANPSEEHDVCEGFHLKHSDAYFVDILTNAYDYFIYSRFVGYISPYLKCHNVYVMVHDIYPISDDETQIGIGRVKKYCYLSDWHKEFLLERYAGISSFNDTLLYKVSNGFSKQYYNNVDLDKKENIFLWSSALNRGFNIFYEYVFYPLFRQFPDLKLFVCTGTLFDADIQMLNAANLLPGVTVLGKLSKRELAEYQKRSKIWVYPGSWPETFCITAVESCAAGCVPICPLSFGLGTTLGTLDYLKNLNLPMLETEADASLYINEITKLLSDDEYRKNIAAYAMNINNIYSWENTADEFINLFESTK